MTLYEGLLAIFEEYGYYLEALESLTLKGKVGVEQIASILADFREHPPVKVAGKAVSVVEDYQSSIRTLVTAGEWEEIALPKSNVLKYELEDGSWLCLRPSGTKPKIKFYFGVKEESMTASEELLEEVKHDVMGRVQGLVGQLI